MPRIDELWAWVAEDDGPTDEGVAAFLNPADGMWMPLVGADRERVESMRQAAHTIALAAGKRIRLVRFAARHDVELIDP